MASRRTCSAGWPARATRPRLPVFVFGMPRSGTTLVEQVLASHSRVHGAGELRLATQVFQSVPAVLGLPDDMAACLNALDAAAVRQLERAAPGGLAGHSPDRPAGTRRGQDAGQLPVSGPAGALVPAGDVHPLRRDLRDVAVSCWMTNFRSIRWANDPEHLAWRCREYRRVMAHWQAVLPVPVHEVVYERLVDDFETEARRLVQACGLEWEPACSRFHQTARPVRTASVTQVRQPLYRRAVARWKHYETALADLFARLPAD